LKVYNAYFGGVDSILRSVLSLDDFKGWVGSLSFNFKGGGLG